MENNNDITIEVRAIDNASGPINAIMKSFDELGRVTKEVTNKLVKVGKKVGVDEITKSFEYAPEVFKNSEQAMESLGVSTKQVSRYMNENGLVMGSNGMIIDRVTGKYVAYGNVIKQTAVKSRRFKMEWLSIMFAGMALSRAFGSIVNAQMELWGISQGISSMWQVVMAPAMQLISDKIWGIVGGMMELPEGAQITIGLTVLGLKGLGDVLSFLGQLYLAGQGLEMLFGVKLKTVFSKLAVLILAPFKLLWGYLSSFVTWISTLKTVFSKIAGWILTPFKLLWGYLSSFVAWISSSLGLGFVGTAAVIIGIIAAITLVIFGAIAAWKNNFLGFKDAVKGIWESIKTIFKGAMDFIKGGWDIVIGIFTLDFEKIKTGINKMGEGAKNMWRGVINFFINTLNSAIGLIIASLAQVVRLAEWVWNKAVPTKKVSWYEDFMKWAKDKTLIPQVPSFQEGGIMPYTGLAMLHQGERIIPKNQVNSSSNTNFSPTINLNAQVSSSYDVRRLAGELNKYWAADFQRTVKK